MCSLSKQSLAEVGWHNANYWGWAGDAMDFWALSSLLCDCQLSASLLWAVCCLKFALLLWENETMYNS